MGTRCASPTDGTARDTSNRRQRERRRLEERRQLSGQPLRLDSALRDPSDPDNPLALSPYYDWKTWSAAHPRWHHGELRRGLRYAMVLDDGSTMVKTYTEDCLFELKKVVETLGPLMRTRRFLVPCWYEELSCNWGGQIFPAMTLDDEHVEQVIAVSRQVKREFRDLYPQRHYLDLLYTGIHELAHARPANQLDRDPEDFLAHREDFQIRHGILLSTFLSSDTTLTQQEKRILRREAKLDDWGRPIDPVPGRHWGLDFDPWHVRVSDVQLLRRDAL